MTKPIFTFIPSAYKEGALYTQLPSGSKFDFSRSGNANRVNSLGLLEEVGNNVPRIDYTNGNCPTFLSESTSSNLVRHSENLQNSSWVKSSTGTNPNVINNNTVSPRGLFDADEIEISGDSQDKFITQNLNLINGENYTLTVYLKGKKGGEQVNIGLRNSSNVGVLGGVFTLNKEWVRYEVTLTATQNNLGFQFFIENPDNDFNFYAWGMQVEQKDYATSYIPTQGSVVSRVSDDFESETFNAPKEGVFYVEAKSLFNNVNSNRELVLRNSDNTKRVVIRYEGSDNIRFYIFDGAFKANQLTFNVGQENMNKIAFKYQQGLQKMFINGQLVASDNDSYDLTGIERLATNLVGFTDFFIKDIRVYDVLTDEEIQNL